MSRRSGIRFADEDMRQQENLRRTPFIFRRDGIQKLLTSYFPTLTVSQLASQRSKYAVVPSFQINSGSAPGAWKPE